MSRRAHDPAAPSLVPAIAAGHRDPIVRHLVNTLTRLYERRGSLRFELTDPRGRPVFPAFPELLARPPRRDGETGEDYERRRSQFMEAAIRVILVCASCCDWRTMQLRDPGGGFLSVKRIAELAELPFREVWPGEDEDRRRRIRMDTVERVLRQLRTSRIICFTKQHREQREDGSYTTTAPALRKLSVSFFMKFGGPLAETFRWRRGKVKERAAAAEQARARAGEGVDLRIREELAKLSRGARQAASSPGAPPPAHVAWRHIPQELADQVAAELGPGALLADVMAEAARRAETRGPPTGSSGEPSDSN